MFHGTANTKPYSNAQYPLLYPGYSDRGLSFKQLVPGNDLWNKRPHLPLIQFIFNFFLRGKLWPNNENVYLTYPFSFIDSRSLLANRDLEVYEFILHLLSVS